MGSVGDHKNMDGQLMWHVRDKRSSKKEIKYDSGKIQKIFSRAIGINFQSCPIGWQK